MKRLSISPIRRPRTLPRIEKTPQSYVHLSREYLEQGIGDPELQETVDTTAS